MGEIMKNTAQSSRRVAAGIVLSGCLLAAVSCSSSEKDKPASSSADGGKRTINTVEGEAGGVVEDTFTASAKVKAIDKQTRKVTLVGESGDEASFIAPPEVRNFDQIKVGDTVKATFAQRLTVFVKEDGAPGEAHTASLTRAPVGASPKATMAESFEAVAVVDAIDSVNRKATLKWSDGDTTVVPVRKDVDLTKYKVGDRVVIRVTERLTVL